MNPRHASCHCGSLTLHCEGEPAKVSMCHCLDCQRRTGSLFSVAVFYPAERVKVGGDSGVFTRGSASGHDVSFHFCRACGSNIFWRPARMPHLIGVAAGSFADPAFPPPEQAVWTQDRHPWLALPSNLPQHDRNPPPRR